MKKGISLKFVFLLGEARSLLNDIKAHARSSPEKKGADELV